MSQVGVKHGENYKVTAVITPELREAIQKEAQDKLTSPTQVIRLALKQYFLSEAA
jgi:hypothetical protein